MCVCVSSFISAQTFNIKIIFAISWLLSIPSIASAIIYQTFIDDD
jgi:hypothetical protein